MDDIYVSVEEVAVLLRVSVETVRAYIKAKKNPLPAYRLGREYRIDKTEFQEWMKTRRNTNEE